MARNDIRCPDLKCPICSGLMIACHNIDCDNCTYNDECTDVEDCEHTELDIIAYLLETIERYRQERDIALESQQRIETLTREPLKLKRRLGYGSYR